MSNLNLFCLIIKKYFKKYIYIYIYYIIEHMTKIFFKMCKIKTIKMLLQISYLVYFVVALLIVTMNFSRACNSIHDNINGNNYDNTCIK